MIVSSCEQQVEKIREIPSESKVTAETKDVEAFAQEFKEKAMKRSLIKKEILPT